jgi:hypothetical protein
VTLLGIVAPALLLVLAVRRWIAEIPWRIALLFIALTVVFLHGAVFTSKLPVPVDEVARGYPWRGIFGDVVARNPSTNDTVKLFLPWMQVAREELLHGRAPLWNPYSFAGYPLLGNGESAPFSPLFLATLFVPLPKQIVAMAGLKIFVALLFTYLFMKRERAADGAAIFAAIAFAWSTVMTVFLYYSTASVIAFLPAAAFASLRAVDEPRKRNVVFVAIVIGTLLANGHPESVMHIAFGCVALLAIDLARSDERRAWLLRFRYALIGVAAGLALSAPAWVPVLEQVFRSARFAELRASPPPASIPHAAAWAIVSPNGFGHPLRHNYSWFVNYATVATSYAGLLPLALFAAAIFAKRDRLLIAASIVFFLIAINWTPIGQIANAIPPFSFVANDKLRFVSIFLIAVVAAKAIDDAKWRVAVAAIPIVVIAIYVYRARAAVMRPIDLAGVVAIALFLALPRKFAPIVIAAELLVMNAGFNALVDTKYFRPRLPIIDALQAHAPKEPFRVGGLDWALLPNASAQYGVEDIRGSDPMASASYDAFLKRFTVQQEGTWVRRVVDAGASQIDALNVRFLIAEPAVELGGKWRLLYRGRDGVLYENATAAPRFTGVRSIKRAGPSDYELDVVSGDGGAIVFSQPGAREWRVEGGRWEAAPNGVLQRIVVAQGASHVRVRYQPITFDLSVLAALAAIALLIGWNRNWSDPVVERPETGLALKTT